MICNECNMILGYGGGGKYVGHVVHCSKFNGVLVKAEPTRGRWKIFDGIRKCIEESYPTIIHTENAKFYKINRGFE